MKPSPKLEDHRIQPLGYETPRGAPWGAFQMRGPCGADLRIVACDDEVIGDLCEDQFVWHFIR